MKELQVAPDANTYGTLINVCGKCKWCNMAMDLFKEMQDTD